MTPRERASRAVRKLIFRGDDDPDLNLVRDVETMMVLERFFPELVKLHDNIEQEIEEAAEEAIKCYRELNRLEESAK